MIRRTAGLACLVFWLCAGVSFMSCDTAPAPAPEEVLQKVTLATPKSSLLGYTLFGGLEKGFFKEESLDLAILDSYPDGKACMEALNAGTRIIGAGNLKHAVEIISRDEIGDLGRAFNKMTASLREITASRNELNNEISERKKAENEARKSKEEWEKTFEAMSDIITIQDQDRRIVRANRAAYEFFRAAPPAP